MLKTAALLFVGLGVGLAIAWWLAPGERPARAAAMSEPAAGLRPDEPSPDAGLASLAAALAFESEQRELLENRVEALAAELEALRGGAAGAAPSDAVAPAAAEAVSAERRARLRRDPAALREDFERRETEALIAAGFPPDRVEWINRRTQELRMQSLQAQYDAAREGRPLSPGAATAGERALRDELGDGDYERYLAALGQPTSVPVRDVLASSPAERAGLKAGDEVVAYDGQRVFDARDLNTLTLEGRAGESVVVEIRRDGQTLQLVMPRGPLGILGGFRGPPR